jgi:hypothetical protein
MKKFLTLTVLGLVLVAAGVFARTTLRTPAKFRPYTIVWRVTDYDAKGNATFRYTETRYADSKGRWHNVKAFAEGGREVSFREPGQGLFIEDEKVNHYVSDAPLEPQSTTLEEWRKSPQFVREDNIAGLPVAVTRVSNRPGDPVLELYHAPDLNNDIVKMVATEPTSIRVAEPISLSLSEPDPSVFRHPDLPTDTKAYEKMHGKAP